MHVIQRFLITKNQTSVVHNYAQLIQMEHKVRTLNITLIHKSQKSICTINCTSSEYIKSGTKHILHMVGEGRMEIWFETCKNMVKGPNPAPSPLVRVPALEAPERVTIQAAAGSPLCTIESRGSVFG